MAKKKSDNKKNLDKGLEDLYDFIKKQDFENIEAMQAFLEQLAGKKLSEVIPQKKGKLSKKEQSRELMYEASEAETVSKARKLAQEAIKLDPDNSDAYSVLGDIEEDLNKAKELYRQGMEAGKREIGEKNFQEMKGHFWGFHETRPFMRAKASYAECLYYLGQEEEAMKQYGEMIELNPNDNQGIRYQYAIMLVQNDQYEEYEKLRKNYGEEGGALWLFTYALYLFKKEGPSENANHTLIEANASNKYVLPFLLGEKKIPDVLPDYYSWGDENEAIIYIRQAAKLWLETEKAISWLHEFKKNS